MKVEWTDFAWEMLSQTADNILYKHGFNTYNTFLAQVNECVGRIQTNPTIAPLEDMLVGRPLEYRSMVVNSLNKIVYTIDSKKETIYITDFWDTRREPQLLTSSI